MPEPQAALAKIELETERLRAVADERRALIQAADAEGASLRQIATAAGMSAEGVRKLLARG